MNLDLSKIEYIDIHSHLQFKSYDNGEREPVIRKMNENKIATICIGTDLVESEKAKDLAIQNENIFYSIALHPHDNLEEFKLALENPEEYFTKLKSLAKEEKCLAIGECGLDYFYDESEKENQARIFRRHLELAQELNLPLMLHIRPSKDSKEDAYLDSIEILKNYKNTKGNFHFFVGTNKVLEMILKDLPNFTVSIPAVCTFTDEYDEMIKMIPLDKIHIETDSPFVLPKARRKEAKQNEPSFVIDVFEKISGIKSIENKENFKAILKDNFQKMFLK